TSKIRLMFDPSSYQLKQWLVTDPQGYDTLVSLYNIDFKEKPDPSLFKIIFCFGPRTSWSANGPGLCAPGGARSRTPSHCGK
ncbi:MAG: hypothetical protein QOG66_1318, partial [Methylobacteriaceae bacterium]|nr:hypothetical protein [Methylobacteriaceae bacterium]